MLARGEVQFHSTYSTQIEKGTFTSLKTKRILTTAPLKGSKVFCKIKQRRRYQSEIYVAAGALFFAIEIISETRIFLLILFFRYLNKMYSRLFSVVK